MMDGVYLCHRAREYHNNKIISRYPSRNNMSYGEVANNLNLQVKLRKIFLKSPP